MSFTLNPPIAIDGLFAGQVARLAGDSRRSAIVKTALSGPCRLTAEGLAGDAQADRRVHGGPGKALHHYPAEHYARLAMAFPAAQHLAPGGLGENVSSRGATENDICIGDVFRFGGAAIQVSQPRAPCWKIDRRTGCDGVATFIADHGLAGWYYRVLKAGMVAPNDRLEHIERPAAAVSLAEFWQIVRQPSVELLLGLADAIGLEPQWAGKLRQRAARLKDNPCGNAA